MPAFAGRTKVPDVGFRYVTETDIWGVEIGSIEHCGVFGEESACITNMIGLAHPGAAVVDDHGIQYGKRADDGAVHHPRKKNSNGAILLDLSEEPGGFSEI